MAGVQVTNNAFSTLAGSINTVVTTMSVQAGHGARFPAASIVSGNYFYVTLLDSGNNLEIVKVTDRTVDVFTIIRARDGTTAKSFIANDRVELRPVAALFSELPNRLLQTADYADLSLTTAKLATIGGLTPNTYGGLGTPVSITVNSKGQVTAISNTAGPVLQNTFAFTGGAQTWTKPAGGTWALIELWAGGGSGGKGRAGSAGGGAGGGQYSFRFVLLSSLGATESVTVGGGGAAQTAADSNGNVGANTTFGSGGTLITAYGGGPGMGTDTTGLNGGGGGGGPSAVGVIRTQQNVNTYAIANFVHSSVNEGLGGKAGLTNCDGDNGVSTTLNGAGGGGACDNVTNINGSGGNSIYGGGGGGAGAEDVAPGPGIGGVSKFGGNGGAGAFDASNATAGVVPGGGGGGSETGNSGAGANGRCVVTVF